MMVSRLWFPRLQVSLLELSLISATSLRKSRAIAPTWKSELRNDLRHAIFAPR